MGESMEKRKKKRRSKADQSTVTHRTNKELENRDLWDDEAVRDEKDVQYRALAKLKSLRQDCVSAKEASQSIESVFAALRESQHNQPLPSASEAVEDDWWDSKKDEYYGKALEKAWMQLLKRVYVISDAAHLGAEWEEVQQLRILSAQRPSQIAAISTEFKILEQKYKVQYENSFDSISPAHDGEPPMDEFPPGYGGDE